MIKEWIHGINIEECRDNKLTFVGKKILSDRYLRPGEIVHHIDGNKENNKIQNLYLTTRGGHKNRYLDGYKEGFAKGFLISYLASRCKNSPK